jgi:hypothetical protein
MWLYICIKIHICTSVQPHDITSNHPCPGADSLPQVYKMPDSIPELQDNKLVHYLWTAGATPLNPTCRMVESWNSVLVHVPGRQWWRRGPLWTTAVGGADTSWNVSQSANTTLKSAHQGAEKQLEFGLQSACMRAPLSWYCRVGDQQTSACGGRGSVGIRVEDHLISLETGLLSADIN